MSGAAVKSKGDKGSWKDEVQRRKYAKEHESNSKVEENDKSSCPVWHRRGFAFGKFKRIFKLHKRTKVQISAIKQRWEELKSIHRTRALLI